MSDLSQLALYTEYRTIKEDPAIRFYRPCLLNSCSYKRAVGYFRSSVYLVIGQSIVEFARRGGTTQLICSPELSPEDIDGIAAGYGRRSQVVQDRLLTEIDRLLSESGTSYPTQILATLIEVNALDIKLAIRADRKGLYHEKIGIFADSLGNRVSFKGSANETWNGWDARGNFESIEVFCSWRGGLEQERVQRHEQHFDSLWTETDPHIEVFPFPQAAKEQLKKAALKGLDDVEAIHFDLAPPRRNPMPHQLNAVEAWMAQGRRGIFEHATGSGKTFTAMLVIREQVNDSRPAIVLVPSVLLLEQWAEELRAEIPDAALTVAGGGHNAWKSPQRLRGMTGNNPLLGGRIVLTTMQTAASDLFLSNISQGDHLLVVADEVHQLGSPQNSRFLEVSAGGRLGLSATPTRYGDPDGTKKILEYFGGIVPPPITLADAIRAGRLVEYEYYPHPVTLSLNEAERWRSFSRQIRSELSRQGKDEQGNLRLSEKAKLLLIQRARIAKKAEAKVHLAREVVRRHFQEGQHWLIYCEDQDQLGQVISALKEDGESPIEYHSSMGGDRHAAMGWFRAYGGLLVAIRCLDEGVDIPSISHALILASSQNPRQFIQRRGRVLRKAPSKYFAVIHDAVVVPVSLDDEPDQAALLKAEMIRSIEFANNAANSMAAAKLREIAIDLGLDPDGLIDLGIEEDDGE